MIQLEPLRPEYFKDIYEICLNNSPYTSFFCPSLYHFNIRAIRYEGFVLQDEGKTVGAITLSELMPLSDATLNIDVDRQYRAKWGSREVFRKVCEFAFIKLNLPRLSSYSIKGVSDYVEPVLAKAGFRVEGVREAAVLYPDGYRDQVLWGMLRHRCRWIV